jgi:hypothetical protein
MLNPHLLTIEKENKKEYVINIYNNIPSSLLLRLDIPEINEEEIKILKENGECIINSKKYILTAWN